MNCKAKQTFAVVPISAVLVGHKKNTQASKLSLRVAITLHQQTKNQIVLFLEIVSKRHVTLYFKRITSGNRYNPTSYPSIRFSQLALPEFACCRRGIRTAHGAVSRDTKFGGLPQSTRVPALYRVCPVVTTPETGGHGCQVSSSYSIKELYFLNLLIKRCFSVN